MHPLVDHNPASSLPRSGPGSRWVLYALIGLMVVVMGAGSFLPPHYKAVLHTHGRYHSWFHVIAFGTLAFLAMRSVESTRAHYLIFAACLLFGWSIEVGESFAFHGLLEWKDVFTDTLGITFATLVALLLPS